MMKKTFSLLSTITLGFGFALFTAQAAQADTLFDFDQTGLADGQVVTNQLDGMSITNGSIGYEGGVSRQDGSLSAFYTRSGFAHDSVDPNRTAAGAAFSGGFLTTASIFSPKNLEIDFDTAASSLSFTVADIEGRETLTAKVFDSTGNLLGSQMLSGSTAGAGDASALLVSFDMAGISRLVLDPGQQSSANRAIGFAIDNISVSNAQSVPEPSVLLGSLGVVALGSIVKRKRNKA